jgi:hypothetical protein
MEICRVCNVAIRAQVRGWKTVSWCSCVADMPNRLHTICAMADLSDDCARPHRTLPLMLLHVQHRTSEGACPV